MVNRNKDQRQNKQAIENTFYFTPTLDRRKRPDSNRNDRIETAAKREEFYQPHCHDVSSAKKAIRPQGKTNNNDHNQGSK